MRIIKRLLLTAIVMAAAYGLVCYPGLMGGDIAGLKAVYAAGQDRTLPDGDYMIAFAGTTDKSSFYYLDIDGQDSAAKTNTNVSICGPDKKDVLPAYDIWNLKYSNGYYTIKQKTSNMVLGVENVSKESGANVKVYKSGTRGAQQWAISQDGSSGYTLQAKDTGLYLDVNNGSAQNGANVQQANKSQSGGFGFWNMYGSGGNSQSWLIIPYKPAQPIGNGRYVLLSRMDKSMELDVVGDTASVRTGTNIQLYKDTASSRFNSFNITKLNNGYYKFIHAASGLAMEVSNGSTSYSSNVALNKYTGSIYQQWAITKAGNGYIVRSRCSGYVLEVMGASKNNGANVVQYPYNGKTLQANQSWFLMPAEYSIKYNANGGSGAPGAQVKYYKAAATLSTAKPYRSGYSFQGWNTKANGTGTTYYAGGKYTAESGVTLYAKWKSNKKSKSKNTSIYYKKSKIITAKSPSKLTLYIKWKKVTGISGYELLVSKTKSFKKDSVSVNFKKSKTSDQFDFLWSGKCYLKMRPYKKSGGKKRYGMWSNIKKVKVK